MAWAKSTKITAWSFSRWSVYDLCPLKAKYKFIDKLPEPGSPAMDRGTAIHTGIDGYLKGETVRVSKDWNPKIFGDLLKGLRAKRKKDPESVTVEDTWAFRADWSETRWDDWNGCWLRVKVDCSTTDGNSDNIMVDIVDWKTGRFRPQQEAEYKLQLDLYALGALMRHQDAKEVSVSPSLVYIDEGVRHAVGTYTKTDMPRLRKEWEKRAKPMLNDTKFAPKPNRMCVYCHYRASNNGPCKY